MLTDLMKKIFGSRNERTVRRLEKAVASINRLEPEFQALSDAELAGKTQAFKARLAKGETLDALLPEAFATVREAARRTLGLRHFDVQLIGGMVLHEGNIAEMRTGEGKTLVATLPAYLNALSGDGVHVVTVNDYLAKRDSNWMRPVFEFLGLSVGVIYPDMPYLDKKAAYQSDILYGTNNEFGFDYLRDNMAFALEDKVQRVLNFAVIDEVDSILIDEARTPLIISGASEGSPDLYIKVNALIPKLRAPSETSEGDYTLDAKQKQVHLTETGHEHIETLMAEAGLLQQDQSLYHAANIILMHHVTAALRAQLMFHKDVDYIVKDNQVVIVDEHTGRTMPGRRWSDGLHQALEAKEGVSIQRENQTLASITFQNFFRMYNKLGGMTGTADTEAYEFQQIYNLEVVVIPTNRPMVRQDEADLIYLSQQDKYQAIIEDVKRCIAKAQPVLVGTASIEASELLSRMMHKEGIKHQVLNAKFHEKEAQIVAEAGRPAAVTIATNMAGRGTDIVLGGSLSVELEALGADADEAEKERVRAEWQKRHEIVLQSGGLRIIGSERHESRRIDNQLRGRAGRQGDPGSSRFYLSLDDNLMRIFASERVVNMMRRLGMQPGEPIEHNLVTKAIENAQRKLEGHNFDIRKQLLEYDNVANNQRKVVYAQRASVMEMTEPKEVVSLMREEVVQGLVNSYIPMQALEEEWDVDGLMQVLQDEFNLKIPVKDWIEADHHLQPEAIATRVLAVFEEKYQEKEQQASREVMAQFEKSVILQTLDSHWREHLAAMDSLRQGIHLRGYAQKDPRQEYKREAFLLFTDLLERIKYDIIRLLTSVEIQNQTDVEAVEDSRRDGMAHDMQYLHADEMGNPVMDVEEEHGPQATFRREGVKVGRNDPCPCGSGKKFKQCHGNLA